MKLSFFGGSGTVTGSKFLLESEEVRILVDCGLFQGVKHLRLKNWDEFPIDPSLIDVVLLTHAHLDHSGYLPRLVNHGFQGPIVSTAATFDLCRIILIDSGHLQEEEAKYRNKTKSSKHHPAMPLYTEKDAQSCLKSFEPIRLGEALIFGPFKVTFFDAGHILGAASIKVEAEGKTIVFSGDIGRYDDLLITSPESCPSADYVIMESTYGNRKHTKEDPIIEIENILKKVIMNNGVLMIPSFAVGRAQTLLYIFHQIFERNPDLRVPVYLNSPMATDVTTLFGIYTSEHKLRKERCFEVCDSAIIINSVEESKDLNEKKGPMVIISASGMLSGGRILHHIKSFGQNPANAILLTGFQSPGTRGHAISDGVRELKIHGAYHSINAQVFKLDSLSAHADQEDLLRWVGKNNSYKCKKVFLVHGEPAASDALRLLIKDRLSIGCEIPQIGDEVVL